MQRAVHDGIVVVAADVAGRPGGPAPFPLQVREVIAIGDADDPAAIDDARAARPRPRLTAPGHAVLTTVPGGRYDYVNGTSMSVALASGVVALLLELRPAMQGAQLRQLLVSTAGIGVPVVDPSRDPSTLDAEGAVRTLAGEVRSSRVAAGTLRCGSAGRSAGCR